MSEEISQKLRALASGFEERADDLDHVRRNGFLSDSLRTEYHGRADELRKSAYRVRELRRELVRAMRENAKPDLVILDDESGRLPKDESIGLLAAAFSEWFSRNYREI